MKLTIYNGSPRGKGGNSFTISKLLSGNFENSSNVNILNLKDVSAHDEIIDSQSDSFLFVFPLYADAMPYAVKAFFEKIEEDKHLFKSKKFYFFIHSGFPEAKQSRLLERYLKYFCSIIGAECMGVCIMGNSEGVRYLTPESKRLTKITQHISMLAQDIQNGENFNSTSIKYFNAMETLPKPASALFKIIPFINIGFNIMLKKKGSYEKRFNQPYL